MRSELPCRYPRRERARRGRGFSVRSLQWIVPLVPGMSTASSEGGNGATLRLRGPSALYCDFFQHKFAPIVHELLAEFGRAGTNLVVRPD